jgi:hypothetical protein
MRKEFESHENCQFQALQQLGQSFVWSPTQKIERVNKKSGAE